MHHKNIKVIVRKQLKKQFPQWRRLPKKEKKRLANMVLEEVISEYDFKRKVEAPMEELLGIENQLPTKDILSLEEMTQFIETFDSDNLIKLSGYRRSPIYIKDQELQFVDELIDDNVINHLLAYDGYSPAMRRLF